jgi:hypothetical protein
MKAVRMTALAIAVALGTNTVATAYAGDGAARRGPQHAGQDGNDHDTAQSDLRALAELVLLSLALLESSTPAASAHVERRTGAGDERQ